MAAAAVCCGGPASICCMLTCTACGSAFLGASAAWSSRAPASSRLSKPWARVGLACSASLLARREGEDLLCGRTCSRLCKDISFQCTGLVNVPRHDETILNGRVQSYGITLSSVNNRDRFRGVLPLKESSKNLEDQERCYHKEYDAFL